MTRSLIEDVWPVTPLQEGLLFHSLLGDDVDVYATQAVFDIAGGVDVEVLRAGAQALVARHAAFRAGFRRRRSGEWIQVVHRSVTVPLSEVDFGNVAEDELPRLLDDLLAEERERRFDLDRPPLLRLVLAHCGKDGSGTEHHRLIVNTHHVVTDGWSTPIWTGDLFELYRRGGDGSGLPPVAAYRDYLAWLTAQDRAAALETWRAALAGIAEPCLLRGREDRHALPEDVLDRMSAAETAALVAMARERGWTVNTMVQIGWALVLNDLTGRTDVVFGGVVSGRPAEVPSVERIVGLLVNTVPVRVRLDYREDAAALLTRVQREQRELDACHHVGLGEVQRVAGHGQLFDTLLAFENYPIEDRRAAASGDRDHSGLNVVGAQSFGDAHYPFSLAVMPGTELTVRISYQDGVVTGQQAAAAARRLLEALRALSEDPDRPVGTISVLGARERAEALEAARGPSVAHPAVSLVELLDAQAAKTPDAVALVRDDDTLTYRELHERAERLARVLAGHGVGHDDRVLVVLPRSVEMVIGLLAVLKAGAAYVPVDPDYPDLRVARLAEQAAPAAIITDRHASRFTVTCPIVSAEDGSAAELPPSPHPDGAAYVIFTSGSTGEPKGVVVSHRAIVNRLRWMAEAFEVGGHDRILQKTPSTFDVSVWELFLPLLTGARLVLAAPRGHRDLGHLADQIDRHGVTLAHFVPSVLRDFLRAAGGRCGTLRKVVVSGEELTADVVAEFYAKFAAELWNLYGPTEAAVDVSAALVAAGTGDGDVPIGSPVDNTGLFVLDGALRPVADGAVGELYLGGVQLARAYLGQQGRTATRFVAAPFAAVAGERLYRTGDLVRRRESGDLVFVGRSDDQVKLHGNRIELGDVEAAFAAHPEVRLAVAGVAGDDQVQRHLVAHVVPADGFRPAPDTAVSTVESWQGFYDDLYRAPSTADFGEDFTGWDSSYDGEPIPVDRMREWQRATVDRIMALRPKRVLELGVGNGLLLAKVAPLVDEYAGADFSASAITELREKVAEDPALAARVRLSCCEAVDLTAFAGQAFDVIVLNSVVQYFPSERYLTEVLTGCAGLLADGGAIFVGDVRMPRVARYLHTGVVLATTANAPGWTALAAVRRGVRTERELLVEPEYFALAGSALDGLVPHVELKAGRSRDELTAFRYDVVLHRRPVSDTGGAEVLRYGRDWRSLDDLRVRLAEGPGALRLAAMPNARCAGAAAALRALDRGETASVAAEVLASGESGAVDPEDIVRVARESGYRAHPVWAPPGEDDTFEAVLVDERDERLPGGAYRGRPGADRADHVREPAEPSAWTAWTRGLLEFVGARLPGHMVPVRCAITDAVPLTPSGKLDRRAFAEAAPAASDGGRGPRTPAEHALSALFAEVLGLEKVSIDDDFFALGGYSLSATRLVTRVRAVLGKTLPLRAVFEARTVAELVDRLAEGGGDELWHQVLPLRTGGPRRPLFCVYGAFGLSWVFSRLVDYLGERIGVYGIQAAAFADHDRLPTAIEEMAAECADAMRTVQPHGPYRVLGWSFGGSLAYAVGTELRARGEEVELLAVMDAYPSDVFEVPTEAAALAAVLEHFGVDTREVDLADLDIEAFVTMIRGQGSEMADIDSALLYALARVGINTTKAERDFVPARFDGDLTFFTAENRDDKAKRAQEWARYLDGGSVREHVIRSGHTDMLAPGTVHVVAEVLKERLDALDGVDRWS